MLVVETGEGVEGANSLVSLDFLDAYHYTHGNTRWAENPDLQVGAAVSASSYFIRRYGPRLKGRPSANSGRMLWPRDYVPTPFGDYYPATEIPEPVREAVAEIALGMLETRLSGPATPPEKSVSIGPIRIDYADTAAPAASYNMRRVEDILGILVWGTGNQIRMRRV